MADQEPKGGLLERLTFAEKIIAIVSAGAIGWTTFQSNTIANTVSEQARQLSVLQETQRREIELQKTKVELRDADVTLTHKIYEEFIEAITDKESADVVRIERLHAVLVLTAAIPDATQREGMARAVKGAIERKPPETKETRELAEAAAFDAETAIARASAITEKSAIQVLATASPPPPPTTNAPRWSNYDFDIFWCDAGSKSTALSERANEIAALRAADPKAAGNWRVRPLPAAVNERVGYKVSGYQIRYSSDDELPFAQELKRQMETKFDGVSAQIVRTNQDTRWYLSVFVCPAVP